MVIIGCKAVPGPSIQLNYMYDSFFVLHNYDGDDENNQLYFVNTILHSYLPSVTIQSVFYFMFLISCYIILILIHNWYYKNNLTK